MQGFAETKRERRERERRQVHRGHEDGGWHRAGESPSDQDRHLSQPDTCRSPLASLRVEPLLANFKWLL